MTSSVRSFVSNAVARCIVATAGAALLPSLLHAQTPAAQGSSLEEIVITARFREEPLQKTPLAITAITGESLELRNAGNVVDIGKFSPNVTINPLGAGYGPTLVANIRGIGLTDFKPVFEPGVPIYVDDVVLARSTGAVLDLLDLERVEVLRGPQGTLFGKNAPAAPFAWCLASRRVMGPASSKARTASSTASISVAPSKPHWCRIVSSAASRSVEEARRLCRRARLRLRDESSRHSAARRHPAPRHGACRIRQWLQDRRDGR